ncbi:MAG: dockerin type I domain-containing protein [Oscillospiraceae bacterium]
MALYMDTQTAELEADVTWTAGGAPVNSAGEMAVCDFNGDGQVDSADGQALLDYVTGTRDSIQNEEHGDLDGNGVVDTYDVHLFASKLGKDTVTVPAGGSVTIAVTIRLTQAQKEFLDAYYTGGAYVEAYVRAEAVATEEGASLVPATPFLCWPSMAAGQTVRCLRWVPIRSMPLDRRKEPPIWATSRSMRLQFLMATGLSGSSALGGDPLIRMQLHLPGAQCHQQPAGRYRQKSELHGRSQWGGLPVYRVRCRHRRDPGGERHRPCYGCVLLSQPGLLAGVWPNRKSELDAQGFVRGHAAGAGLDPGAGSVCGRRGQCGLGDPGARALPKIPLTVDDTKRPAWEGLRAGYAEQRPDCGGLG